MLGSNTVLAQYLQIVWTFLVVFSLKTLCLLLGCTYFFNCHLLFRNELDLIPPENNILFCAFIDLIKVTFYGGAVEL